MTENTTYWFVFCLWTSAEAEAERIPFLNCVNKQMNQDKVSVKKQHHRDTKKKKVNKAWIWGKRRSESQE